MNNKKMLDLSSLVEALNSLEEALLEYKKHDKNAFVRDATIQRFEYSYELSHKMLKRYLEMTESNSEDIGQMAFSNLIRTASERGLLASGWEAWSVYRHARNLTSHTYNEAKAIEVCAVIPAFYKDAQFLLVQLQARAIEE